MFSSEPPELGLGLGFFCFFVSLRALPRPLASVIGRREDDGSGRETVVERQGEAVGKLGETVERLGECICSTGLPNAIGLDRGDYGSENRSGDGAAAQRGAMSTEERAGSRKVAGAAGGRRDLGVARAVEEW
jgi:hypothetical protein